MRLAALALFVTSLFINPSASAADRFPIDWPKLDRELLEYYSALIRIDTSNPPGNETKAVNYIKPLFDREGIPYQVFAMNPDRANIVARLKGNGSKRPIIVMGHTDVVGVQREKWSVDPFAAIRKDGYVYGRGTQDDKDNLATGVMLMLTLKRLNVSLDRDVIFIAEAGEEGTSSVGIEYLVKEHWDAIGGDSKGAEFALAEGGGGESRQGKVRFVNISTTEKVPRSTRLIAHGTAGHGSVPRLDNPVVHLAEAVAKVGAWQPPMRLNDTTRTYFERLATISSPEDADRYNHLADPKRAAAIQKYFSEHELTHYSMLRTSVVPTIIKAGFRSNVIPSEAEATIDIRALPDEDMTKLYAELRRVINDPAVDVVGGDPAVQRPASPPSRLDAEMFHTLENVTKTLYPGAVTLPSMLTGATDMAQLRAKGVQSYGIGSIVDEKDRSIGGAHSDDERLEEAALYRFMQFLWNTVTEVAAKK
jgi:acetylornithine deacetylase/succinyl-diaminopimelate desuccinylase-like protein